MTDIPWTNGFWMFGKFYDNEVFKFSESALLFAEPIPSSPEEFF